MTGVKFAYQPVLAVLLVCHFSTCLAAETPDPTDPNKYLNAVRTFADNVLKYGRDTYGPKHTPLFVDGLNVNTHEPVKWIDPDGYKWILCNLASQQNLFRTLDGLTKITGDPIYKQAAMDAINFAFENLRSPNGLLHWGGHQAYDVGADRPRRRNIHEFKCFYPYYDLMWEVDPKATKQFIEAFWSGHVLDWSDLSSNRHASDMTGPLNKPWDYQYKREPVFVRTTGTCDILCGSDLYYAAAWLTKSTGDEEPLLWSKRLAYRFVQTRNPKTGLGTIQFSVQQRAGEVRLGDEVINDKLGPSLEIFPHQWRSNREHREIGHGYDMPTPGAAAIDIIHSPWICQLMLGDLLGEEGKEFTQWAVAELTARGKVAYRKSDNVFVPVLRDGTSLEGYVCKENGPLGRKGTALEPLTAGTVAFWAYSFAYCLTSDEFMWEMARNIAMGNNYGDLGANGADESRLNLQTDTSDPYVIVVFLELYKKTGRRPFLEMAKRIGDNVLSGRFYRGFFVAGHKHVYTKFDAIDSLALLHLHSALIGDTKNRLPKVWPARSFLELPYRKKDNAIDNQIIYTLTDSFDVPLSLQEAAAMGNLDLVKSFLEEGANVDSLEGTYAWTALHLAAMNGHADVVRLLLTKGADVTALGGWRAETALHSAVRSRSVGKEIIEVLLDKGVDINARDFEGQSPLDIAINQNRKEIIDLLIEKGAVSLHTAARYGLLEKLKELIGKGTDVNVKDNAGQTPLDIAMQEYRQEITRLLAAKGAEVSVHVAAFTGDIDKVKAFMGDGGSVDTADASGQTLLHWAAAGNHKDIAELLVSHGANVNVVAGKWKTPLGTAARTGSIDVAEYLIAHGANVNAGEGYWTPLQEAAYYSKEMVELLLAKGANINTGKWTALHSVLDAERFDILELLLAKGADVNIRDDKGRTPLHIAAWYAAEKNPKVVELILSKGADVNAKDGDGRTPLYYAKEQGHTEIVELLRKHGAKE